MKSLIKLLQIAFDLEKKDEEAIFNLPFFGIIIFFLLSLGYKQRENRSVVKKNFKYVLLLSQ